MSSQALRRGDLVEIRSPGEILATLDENGFLEALPFMPEMIARCGQRVLVDRIADKFCEYATYVGSRKLPDAVLLLDQRCSGSGHDGCQARCRIFWKNAWLRKVTPGETAAAPFALQDVQALTELTQRAVRHMGAINGKEQELWRCQLTEMMAASQPVSVWNPKSYIGQYTNGNVSLKHCVRVTARAAIEEPLRRLGVTPAVHLPGTATGPVDVDLNLQPGEWVQVLSKEEIAATLMPSGRNRGMWFDREMLPFCGGKYRVEQRIVKIIDDIRNIGQMVEFKTSVVTLEGVACSGDLSTLRWFCPRAITPYWREAWLKRVAAPAA